MNNLLEDELEWVDNNPHRYESDLHAESVKQNIRNRYEIKKLKDTLKIFADALPESIDTTEGDIALYLPIKAFKDAQELV